MGSDPISTGVGYLMGITYAIIVFVGFWDVQRKKNTILGDSLEDSEELYKAYLGMWAMGFLFNPLAYYLSGSIYLGFIDGLAAFTFLIVEILSYRRYRFFKIQKLLQEAIAKGVEIGMKKLRRGDSKSLPLLSKLFHKAPRSTRSQ